MFDRLLCNRIRTFTPIPSVCRILNALLEFLGYELTELFFHNLFELALFEQDRQLDVFKFNLFIHELRLFQYIFAELLEVQDKLLFKLLFPLLHIFL